MGLTAREWLLLPRKEQETRSSELSPEECRKLRMELSMIYFSEEQKRNMSEEEKYKFTHLRPLTEEEKIDRRKSDLWALKEFGMIPKEVSFEQWFEKGCPLRWKE